jgi:tRNA(Ile)-lysidine synthase
LPVRPGYTVCGFSNHLTRSKAKPSSLTTPVHPSLLPVIRKAIVGRRLFGPGARIVAAVSGGPDSICLLHLLCRLRREWAFELSVAHFEHGLRGAESRSDARFVERLCKRLGLQLHAGHGDVKGFARDAGLGVQEAARVMRYEFLDAVRKSVSATHVATAHTADDQAEEVLLRLIRGAGLPGLSGIPWMRDGGIVRPLLGVTRNEILAHLKAYGIPFVVDSSNDNTAYLRNRVRRNLLPVLAGEFNPAIVRTLNRTAEMLSEDQRVLADMAEDAYRESALAGPTGTLVFDVDGIRRHPAPIRRRIYLKAIADVGLRNGRLTSDHLMAVDRLALALDPAGSYRLPGAGLVRRNYDRLCFSKTGPLGVGSTRSAGGDAALVSGPGRWPAPTGAGFVEILCSEVRGDLRHRVSGQFPRTLFVDPAVITFPLCLRTRRPGESFHPYGATTGLRLKKFLISRKVPRDIRDTLPLLIHDSEVVAVVGLEIAHAYRLRESSRHALSIRWISAI